MQHSNVARRIAGMVLAKAAARSSGYHPVFRAPGAQLNAEWAKQAQRHLSVYHQSRKKVAGLEAISHKPVVGTTVAAPANAGSGFGGAGYSGAPSTRLGTPQTAGTTVAPPQPPTASTPVPPPVT
jgi:hypothetical protein